MSGTREIEHADDAVLESGESDIPEAEDDDVELTEIDVSGKITIVVGGPSGVHVLLYSF